MSIQTSEPGFTLKKLKHDDFHIICGMREEVKNAPPDQPNFLEYVHHTGNQVLWERGTVVILEDNSKGVISGFAVDRGSMETSPYARINGRLYHVRSLKRA